MKIKSLFRKIVTPLPKPEIVAKKYYGTQFLNISNSQILEIIKVIIKEVDNSRTFNFYLRPEDVDKEILVWLILINQRGGISHVIKNDDFDYTGRQIGHILDEMFSEEHKYYSDRIKKTHETSSQNAFGCHLLFVRSSLLNDLYFGKIK